MAGDQGPLPEQPGSGFAGLLRQFRMDARLTQEELAEAATVSARTVSDLERGVNRTAQKETARLLADALGLAEPVHGLFVDAARGRVPAATVRAARRDAPARLAAAALDAGAAGHDASAAPSPVPSPVPRELPADVSGFTGRATELAELDWLLPAAEPGSAHASGPVVIGAISGTPGVGKTALALRWAHLAAAEFPDGQLYVNLRGYDPEQPVSAAEALARFLRTLGVADSGIPLGEAERAARYRSLVAGRRMLVLLDNAASEEQVRPLLPGAGSGMVIVTSRDSLPGLVALDGARRLELDLLPAADAVALLRKLIGPRAEVDPKTVRELADRCARLPLALRVAAEMAVARPDAPLAAVVAELADYARHPGVLAAGEDRRSAVTEVFSWSYRHLSDAAARTFRLVALHPGADWDRSAAAALTDTSLAETGKLLSVLVRSHLVEVVGQDRYRMHDLLRAYAARLAYAEDSADSRRAALTGLFDYYLAACIAAMDVLAPADGYLRPDAWPHQTPLPEFDDAAAVRAWLDAELPVLSAVVTHTCEHGWPGHTIGLADVLFPYLDAGGTEESFLINKRALDAARVTGDRVAEARALSSLGYLSGARDSEQAESYHGRALAIASEVGDRREHARALSGLGRVCYRKGRYEAAAAHMRRASELAEDLGDGRLQSVYLINLGLVYFSQGNYQQAAEHNRRALSLLRGLRDWTGIAAALTNLGEVLYYLGSYQQSLEYQREALSIGREIGLRGMEAEALARLADLYRRWGHLEQAAAYDRQALAIRRETANRNGEADALNGAAETLLATGNPEQARACHEAALALGLETGDRSVQARAFAGLAAVCRAQGDHVEAGEFSAQALTIYRDIGDPGGEAAALNGAAETQLAMDASGEARANSAAALAIARRTGVRYQEARALHGLALASLAAGERAAADEHWQLAAEIYTELGVPEAAQSLSPSRDISARPV
jgi:tetratricopeptide (TPR) repeat protein/transcriptional regulator with XRE-family HTH domain